MNDDDRKKACDKMENIKVSEKNLQEICTYLKNVRQLIAELYLEISDLKKKNIYLEDKVERLKEAVHSLSEALSTHNIKVDISNFSDLL